MAPPIHSFDKVVARSPRMKREKIMRKILKIMPYIILLILIFLSLRALGR